MNHYMKTYLTFDQIKDSGLLSLERMAEVESEIQSRFEPLFSKEGQELKNLNQYWLSKDGEKKHYLVMEHGGAKEYAEREVMQEVLTQEEIELVDKNCFKAQQEQRDAAAFEKAEKILAANWNGWVYWSEYHDSVESFLDWWECYYHEEDVKPTYIWACKPVRVIDDINAADIAERFIEDNGWDEMALSDLNGLDDLDKALKKFIEDNKDIVSYDVDYSKAIML